MKLFTGWAVCAALVLSAPTADAQLSLPRRGASPMVEISDFDQPYSSMPPEVPSPRLGPMLLPPEEVYAVLRDNGFSPLGTPRLRGIAYTIAAIDRDGEDGRLIIDARSGRIIRFIPADRRGDGDEDDFGAIYSPAGPIPPATPVRSVVPRPPAPIPHVASRRVPEPKPSPLAARSALRPYQRSAAVQPRTAEPAPVRQAAGPTIGAAAPVEPALPAILPTKDMPKVQGLE